MANDNNGLSNEAAGQIDENERIAQRKFEGQGLGLISPNNPTQTAKNFGLTNKEYTDGYNDRAANKAARIGISPKDVEKAGNQQFFGEYQSPNYTATPEQKAEQGSIASALRTTAIPAVALGNFIGQGAAAAKEFLSTPSMVEGYRSAFGENLIPRTDNMPRPSDTQPGISTPAPAAAIGNATFNTSAKASSGVAQADPEAVSNIESIEKQTLEAIQAKNKEKATPAESLGYSTYQAGENPIYKGISKNGNPSFGDQSFIDSMVSGNKSAGVSRGLFPVSPTPEQQPQAQDTGYQTQPIKSNILPDSEAVRRMRENVEKATNVFLGGELDTLEGRQRHRAAGDFLKGAMDFDIAGNQKPQLDVQKMAQDESQFGRNLAEKRNEFASDLSQDQEKNALIGQKNWQDYMKGMSSLANQRIATMQKGQVSQKPEAPTMLDVGDGVKQPIRFVRDSKGNPTGYVTLNETEDKGDLAPYDVMSDALQAAAASQNPKDIKNYQKAVALNKMASEQQQGA